MGCIKYAMPLLSTLAALVIIVHTAEEDYEQDHRGLRPRPLDVDAPHLEQAWRNMEMDPVMTQSPPISQGDVWDESNPEPPLRRRRPGRKRKRRPMASQEDDLVTQERYINPDESRPRRQENIDTPRRRRKKIFEDSREGVRWTDEGAEQLRRRGQRRKRPIANTMSELSEFNDYRLYERQKSEETVDNTETKIDDTHYKEHNINKDEEKRGEVGFDKNEHENEFIDISTAGVIEHEQRDTIQPNDDISLSEFSSEIGIPEGKSNRSDTVMKEKIRDKKLRTYKDTIADKSKSKQIFKNSEYKLSKSVGVEKCLEKIKILRKRATKNEPSTIPFEEHLPLDPQTLKTILKRSNGKSLSEILQQNNLTLADLLRGKERALTILQNDEFESNQETNSNKMSDYSHTTKTLDKVNIQDAIKNEYEENGQDSIEIETTTVVDIATSLEHSQENIITRRVESVLRDQLELSSESPRTTKQYLRRRLPVGMRRKIRMKSIANNTYKSQLNRDLIAQSSIKYKNNRNVSRPRDWKDFMPSRVKIGQSKTQSITEHESHVDNITTTTYTPQESTTQETFETTTDSSSLQENTEMPIASELNTEILNTSSLDTITESIQTTTESVEELQTENIVVSEKPTSSPMQPTVNASDLRRQVFNNRLKRKRLRQKVSSTELPDNVSLQQIFGESNFVSASEFITKLQTKTTNANEDEFSTLEDFFTTEPSQNVRRKHKNKMLTSTGNDIALTTPSTITTDEIAKIEIEEILKDSLTHEKLTKILKERNMTLSELIAHRERGSSHLHLADIFHNASREPNPPEPFLTKSLIEPISKETYPLNALLEANLYDAKTTTVDPNIPSNLNIPVVMDFGNNVNEIGENMGIIALFNNFSKSENISVNVSDKFNEEPSISNSNTKIKDTTRDGRSLSGNKDSVTWNDLITLMQKNHRANNDVDKTFTTDMTIPSTFMKMNTEDDTDDDGLIIFEDLQRVNNIDNKIDSDELLEINLFEKKESPLTPGVIASPASNTRSVTVATLSIIGLALILFLLTYAAIKWKQQSIMFHKKQSAEDVCVPSPIFESRKTQKLNSSTRSMSPMLSTNIYAIDSLDTRGGNESPEYMWDTLRKPYQ